MDAWQQILRTLARWNGLPVEDGATVRLVFDCFPSGGLGLLITVGLAALFLAGFFSFRGLAPRARPLLRTLTRMLRALALLLTGLVILGPSLVVANEKTLPGTTIVMVDTSWSMRRADPGAKETRSALVDRFMRAGEGAFLEELARRNRLEVYTFDSDTRPLVLQDGAWQPLDPRGPATNLTAALGRILEQERSGRVAGAVLFTDGRWNEGGPPAEMARRFKARHIPLHLVGVGDPSPRNMVRILALNGPERAFAKDPFDLQVTCRGPGPAGQVLVELWDLVQGEEPRKLESRTLETDDEGLGKTTFHVVPRRAGVHSYRIRAGVPGAPVEDMTDRQLVVEIATRPARTLLIAGSPTWEYRALRRLLARDQTVDLSCWLQSADAKFPQQGNTPLKKLPRTLEELRPYHTVIMVDPDPSRLDLLLATNLEKAVREEGTGFAYIAGEKCSLTFFNTSVRNEVTGPLVNLLPARPDQEVARVHIGVSRILRRPWALEITPTGSRDRLLSDGGRPERTRTAFRSLPGFYWNYPFRNPAPGAHILAVHTGPDTLHSTRVGPRPLMLWHHVGAGRVFLSAIDETWRWRGPAERTWDRLWVRLTRFLAEGKLLGDRSLHRLVTDRRTYEVGSEILLVDKRPLGDATTRATALVSRNGKQVTTLTMLPAPELQGDLKAIFVPRDPGLYQVELADLDKTQPARFEVREPGQEDRGPLAAEQLQALAAGAGGDYRPLAEAASIPAGIEEATETLITESRPKPLWDNLVFLLAAVVFLALEWGLRKWMNLP